MAEPIILSLPVLSSQSHVKLPPEPTSPPGPKDITNALRLTNDLVNARRRNEVTDDDVSNGVLYQHKLISAKAAHVGDVPAWFVQVLRQALDPMDRKMDKLTNDVQKLTNDIQTVKNEMQTVKNDIQTIKNHIQTVKNDIQTVQNDIQSMKQAQDHIRRISAILYNHSQGSSDDAALEVVPFENGDDPTKPPHNLPPLTTVKAVT